MKILHVFNVFHPLAGGTADLMCKLTSALAQRGHDVTIFGPDSFRIFWKDGKCPPDPKNESIAIMKYLEEEGFLEESRKEN